MGGLIYGTVGVDNAGLLLTGTRLPTCEQCLKASDEDEWDLLTIRPGWGRRRTWSASAGLFELVTECAIDEFDGKGIGAKLREFVEVGLLRADSWQFAESEYVRLLRWIQMSLRGEMDRRLPPIGPDYSESMRSTVLATVQELVDLASEILAEV